MSIVRFYVCFLFHHPWWYISCHFLSYPFPTNPFRLFPILPPYFSFPFLSFPFVTNFPDAILPSLPFTPSSSLLPLLYYLSHLLSSPLLYYNYLSSTSFSRIKGTEIKVCEYRIYDAACAFLHYRLFRIG